MPGVSIRGGRLDTRTQEEDDVEAEDSRDPAEYRSLQGPLHRIPKSAGTTAGREDTAPAPAGRAEIKPDPSSPTSRASNTFASQTAFLRLSSPEKL